MEKGKSPGQRVRNILTLEERVRVIQAYDRKPMYTKVASMFNCSWEQIKNIILNRKAIMDFYEATKAKSSNVDPDLEILRQRKINFLGECMYEYIQRAQFHTKADLNEDMIRVKAFEFREVIQIENFLPNKAWLNQFKATYNISLSQRQIMLTRTPPASLDLKDIMTYCSRNGSARNQVPTPPPKPKRNLYKVTTTMAINSANDATLEEFRQRRQRKINFLEKALYEYIQRSQFHHKIPLNEDLLRKVACELRDMLKIENFYPNKAWFNHFKVRFDFCTSQRTIVFTRTPPFSLDLKDILSYCSRHDTRSPPRTLDAVAVAVANEAPRQISVRLQGAASRGSGAADPDEAVDVKPDLGASPPPSGDAVRPGPARRSARRTRGQPAPVEETATESETEPVTVTVEEEEEEVDIKPNIAELQVEREDVGDAEEPLDEELMVKEEAAETSDDDEDEVRPPPLKIKKIESMCDPERVLSPGHWSEPSEAEEPEELPRQVKSYADALKLLRPLEEFAMLEENYRVIGLISQLEEIFKNPPPPAK